MSYKETMNEMVFKEVLLKRLDFWIKREIPKHMIDDVQFPRDIAEDVAHNLIVQIKAAVATESLEPIEIKYPENWIEAVKERWLPKRLKKKFPVKYKSEKVGADVFYPNISLPEYQSYVKVRKVE